MRLFIFLIILSIWSCHSDEDFSFDGQCDEDCKILNPYSFSASPAPEAIELNYGLSIIVDGSGKTCYPDALVFYISKDNVDYEKVASVEPEEGTVTIENLIDRETYSIRMVNQHCELDSIVSPIVTINVGEIPLPKFIDNPQGSTSRKFEDFRLSPDGDQYIYRNYANNWFISSLSTGEMGHIIAKDAFHAQWDLRNINNIAVVENINVDILSNLQGTTSKYLVAIDADTQSKDTLHDIVTPYDFDRDKHDAEQYWIHEFHYAIDDNRLYFTSNKDNGCNDHYEQIVYDNIWMLDLATKEISSITDFLPIAFDMEDFVEDPIQPSNYYVAGITNVENTGMNTADSQKYIDIYYYNSRDNTLTPFLKTEHNKNHLSMSPNGEHLLFVSKKSGSNEVWCYHIESQQLKQITNSKLYSPSYRWHHLNWVSDTEFMTYVKHEDVYKFALFNIIEE